MSRRKNKPPESTGAVVNAPPGGINSVRDHLPNVRPVAARVEQLTTKQTRFEGPIPHPEIFRQYGEVIPDAPERILKVFEDDSKHSREIQLAALNAEKGDNRRVHWMAWSLIAGGYATAIAFALMNKDWLAGITLSAALGGTILGFIQGRKPPTTD